MERIEENIAAMESEQTLGAQKLQGDAVENFGARQKRLGELAGLIQSETREWVRMGEELEELRAKVG